MKIRIKNYEIEQDRSCYVLSTYKTSKEGKNIWEEYIADQIYPATLQSALEKVAEKIKNKDIELDIHKLLEYIKKENESFIDQIKEVEVDIEEKAKEKVSKVAKEKQV